MQHNADPVSICSCGGAGWQVSESCHPWGLGTDRQRVWWVLCPAQAAAKAEHSLVPASQQFLPGGTQRGEGGRHHLALERSVGPRLVVMLLAACAAAEAESSLWDVSCAKSQCTAGQPAGAGTACWGRDSQGLEQRAHSSWVLVCGVCPCFTEGDKLVPNPLCQAEQHLHISHSDSGSQGAGPAWH